MSKGDLLRKMLNGNKDKIDIILEIFGAITNEEKHIETDFIEKQRICKNIKLDEK